INPGARADKRRSTLTLPWWEGPNCSPPSKKGKNVNQQFQVQGMSCGHCVGAVTNAVRALDPQAQVKVDLATGQVDVQSQQERAAIVEAIEEEGYRVAG